MLPGDADSVPDYCLELYLARDSRAGLEEAAGRARAAAESFAARGGSVRYLRSTYLPEDETCLHFFAAASDEDVAEAARQAGLTGNRITRSIDADQPSRRVHEIRRAPTERGVP
jgi:2-hydroxychromene-2-carboxylate isomerase